MSALIRIETSESRPFVVLPTFVNGKGPFAFVLDTGAAMPILTEALAGVVGIRNTQSREALGAAGKRITVLVGTADSISIGESFVENVQVGILQELPKCVGQGVVGYTALKNSVLTINYRHNWLTLTSPTESKGIDHVSPAAIPFRLAQPNRPIILVDVLVNALRTYQFILDTGASQTVVSPQLAQQVGMQTVGADSFVAAGGSVRSSAGILRSLSLGDAHSENATVIVSDTFSALGAAAGAEIHGILGYDFLRKFKIVIDYPNQVLRLDEEQ